VQKLSRTRTEVVDIFIDRQQTGKTMDMELEELLFAKKKRAGGAMPGQTLSIAIFEGSLHACVQEKCDTS
jgi:hypothetical protein